jgi:SAM-dependent methyltransferase
MAPFPDSARNWSQAAEGWARWWPVIERGTQAVSDRLIQLAQVQSGDRVLDVATGMGEPAITAARRVGLVVAIDRSPEMLALARRRAASLGLENIEFLQMDAERMGFPECSFHAVLCRFGLMFFSDLIGALTAIHRVLVPGGRMAAAVWAEPSKVPLIALPLRIIGEALQKPMMDPERVGPFRLVDSQALSQALERAGFTNVRSEGVTVKVEFRSSVEYAEFAQAVLPERQELAHLPPEQQSEIWQTVAEHARSYQGPDGIVRFFNQALCIRGERDS